MTSNLRTLTDGNYATLVQTVGMDGSPIASPADYSARLEAIEQKLGDFFLNGLNPSFSLGVLVERVERLLSLSTADGIAQVDVLSSLSTPERLYWAINVGSAFPVELRCLKISNAYDVDLYFKVVNHNINPQPVISTSAEIDAWAANPASVNTTVCYAPAKSQISHWFENISIATEFRVIASRNLVTYDAFDVTTASPGGGVLINWTTMRA